MSRVADVLLTWTEHAQPIHKVAIGAIGSDSLVSNEVVATLLLLYRDGPQRPTRIAELTRLTSGGATKLITRLEMAGLVVREADAVPTDGRAVVVSLTKSGNEKMEEFVAVVAPYVEDFIDALDAIRVDA